ncbi:PaaX family transcriptional regulator [Jannaschia sp. S6380]|uniref:PaaX family transcriptional regulator C-terminal domain-containing protein n=1 Tax=Jannaschia sp. S6380 TaxID=2926408 RepID=UPI001FF455E4|nr:PaaX family transcriptional regulator C-terminal domain-containing protein [Jannaschia sp. S6380]MCK0168366.1 PaaX family transcriptional regulator [Jannaschia sp. S6380]
MQAAIDILTDGRPPRVWSMLVTIFGDLALAEGARLSGPQLAALTEPMGIRPEALRTALHRLRKEGWIASRRDGRTTSHGLTPWGREQSRAAAPRIYSDRAPETLFLIVTEPGSPLPGAAFAITANVALSADPAPDALALSRPPPWMRGRVCPEVPLSAATDVARRFAAVAELPRPTDPLQMAILRVLIVHAWRRIVLRVPDLPDRAFPDGWRGAEGRRLMRVLLDGLPKPPVETLPPVGGGRDDPRPPETALPPQNGESG